MENKDNYQSEGNVFSRVYSRIKDAYFNHQVKKLEKTQEKIVDNLWDYKIAQTSMAGFGGGDIEKALACENEKNSAAKKLNSLGKKHSRLLKKLNKD